MKKILIGIVLAMPLFILSISTMANPPADNSEEQLTCYTFPEITSISLGVGYVGGEGQLYCDDGSSAQIELTGFQVLNVGFSHADRGDTYLVFTGAGSIEDVSGTYHGIGIQLSASPVFNGDFNIYTNGTVTMKWAAPAFGIEVGAHYRNVSVELENITPPSESYSVIPRILETLTLVFEQNEEFNVLPLKVKPDPTLDIPGWEILGRSLRFKLEREDVVFDDFLWENDRPVWDLFAGGDMPLPFDDLHPEPPFLSPIKIPSSQFQPGETYILYVGYTGERPGIYYQYRFTLPAHVEPGLEISADVERERKF